ncbi:MAG: hypothetical protein SF172_10985 [Burkholderiales bacterium]|nr:hypothetical protein [Burkholderiales bacterium]
MAAMSVAIGAMIGRYIWDAPVESMLRLEGIEQGSFLISLGYSFLLATPIAAMRILLARLGVLKARAAEMNSP